MHRAMLFNKKNIIFAGRLMVAKGHEQQSNFLWSGWYQTRYRVLC